MDETEIEEQELPTKQEITLVGDLDLGNITMVVDGEQTPMLEAYKVYINAGLSKPNYTRWMNNHIREPVCYEERVDYILIAELPDELSAPLIHSEAKHKIYVSLDTAKHICMLANTKNGFAIRKYFIEQEKMVRKEANRLLELERKQLKNSKYYAYNYKKQALVSNSMLFNLSEKMKELSPDSAKEELAMASYGEKYMSQKFTKKEKASYAFELSSAMIAAGMTINQERIFRYTRNLYPKYILDAFFELKGD